MIDDNFEVGNRLGNLIEHVEVADRGVEVDRLDGVATVALDDVERLAELEERSGDFWKIDI